MKTALSCTKCHNDAPEYEVAVCTQCLDAAICCDCRTALQAELGVCSDDCAIDSIARMKSDLRSARSAAARMAAELRRIKAIEPATSDDYPRALGNAQGLAMIGLACWTPIDEATAGPLVSFCDDRKVA